ncbi:alpha-L-fucosidase [Bacteroidota bacterium]
MKRIRISHYILLILFLLVLNSCNSGKQHLNVNVPPHLKDYTELYQQDPRAANLKWFKEAGFGLFMHYGLYSQLGEGEWVQLSHDPPIPVSDYDSLRLTFTAENFNAEFITDLTVEAGMKYINITSKHHDGFCLFETDQTDFNVTNSPCKRDLIAELADACDSKGLGLFLYYSYAADWKHPYFYSREAGWQNARPAYTNPQPEYLFEKNEDFRTYIEFVHAQLKELLTRHKNLAGIWFDPIMGYYSRPDLFPIEETYQLVHSLNPHILISFKQGANGTEDFAAPERSGGARVGEQFEIARKVYDLNKNKPKEICTTMQPHLPGWHGGATWGYNKGMDGKHLTSEQVIEQLKETRSQGHNLLLNVGPLPDGSFPEEDIAALKEVGKFVFENPDII